MKAFLQDNFTDAIVYIFGILAMTSQTVSSATSEVISQIKFLTRSFFCDELINSKLYFFVHCVRILVVPQSKKVHCFGHRPTSKLPFLTTTVFFFFHGGFNLKFSVEMFSIETTSIPFPVSGFG